MKKIIIVTCLTVLPSITFAAAHGKKVKMKTVDQQSKFGITAKVGTLGAGLDLTFKIKPKINFRLNANGANINYDEIDDGVAYKGDLKLSTFGALVDYYPFGNGFRATGGLYNNNNNIDGSSAGGNVSANIGGTDYNISAATIRSQVGFKSTAPYLGVGWGNAVKGYKNFNFNLDAGVLFQGSPKAKLTASGTATVLGINTPIDVANNSIFQSKLRDEEKNLNNDLKDYKYLPVIAVGFSYNF